MLDYIPNAQELEVINPAMYDAINSTNAVSNLYLQNPQPFLPIRAREDTDASVSDKAREVGTAWNVC